MSNWFKQHIPTFVDSELPQKIPFETTEELLNLEIVQKYKDSRFSHFAMSDDCLMVIRDNGASWWVVGYVGDLSKIDLPIWQPPKVEVQLFGPLPIPECSGLSIKGWTIKGFVPKSQYFDTNIVFRKALETK